MKFRQIFISCKAYNITDMKRYLLALLLLGGWAAGATAKTYPYPSPLRMTVIESVAYEVYKSQIDSIVNIVGPKEIDLLWAKTPSNKEADLARYITLRERRKCTYDFIYPRNDEKRLAARQRIDTQFQDSIDAILMLYPGMTGRYTQRLLLSPRGELCSKAQYDSLVVKGLAMYRKKLANPAIDLHNDDIAALQSTLSDYELHELIRFACLKPAYKQTQEIWRILDKNDLTQYYDFERAYPELYHFVQKETVAKELYKNDPQRLMQAFNSLQKEMPDTYRAYLLLMMQHKGNLIDSNQLYTIVDGKIITRPEYVDTLSGSEEARGYGKYRLVCREVDTFSVVELYKYAHSPKTIEYIEKNPGKFEEDGGDIQIISITNRRCKKTVHIEYFDGWAKSHRKSIESYPTEEDCYFVTIPVSPTSVAYLFFSCSYEQFGYVTVVLSTDKDIAIVYQKRSIERAMTKNSAGQYDRVPLYVTKPLSEYTDPNSGDIECYEDAIVVENGKLVYKRNAEP